MNQEPQVASSGGHLIRFQIKLDRLVIKQEWLIRQLKQNVCNTLFHRLLLATQVWQRNYKKRNFCHFLVTYFTYILYLSCRSVKKKRQLKSWCGPDVVVFDRSNQLAKDIRNGLSMARVYNHYICTLINSSLKTFLFFHFVSVTVLWKSVLRELKPAENVSFPHPTPIPIIALLHFQYVATFHDNSEIKLHVHGKRQTSESSWEFLKIENKQIKTTQSNSYG